MILCAKRNVQIFLNLNILKVFLNCSFTFQPAPSTVGPESESTALPSDIMWEDADGGGANGAPNNNQNNSHNNNNSQHPSNRHRQYSVPPATATPDFR